MEIIRLSGMYVMIFRTCDEKIQLYTTSKRREKILCDLRDKIYNFWISYYKSPYSYFQ
jgi:hypothetical protein